MVPSHTAALGWWDKSIPKKGVACVNGDVLMSLGVMMSVACGICEMVRSAEGVRAACRVLAIRTILVLILFLGNL